MFFVLSVVSRWRALGRSIVGLPRRCHASRWRRGNGVVGPKKSAKSDAVIMSDVHGLPHPEGSQHNQDVIRVRNLLLLAHVADGAQWPSLTSAPVRQPVQVSVDIPYDLRAAAEGDDISKSINYGSLSKRVLASVENSDPSSSTTCTFRSLEHLSDHIFRTCFGAFPEIQHMTLDVVKPRALPYADGIRVLSSRARDGSRLSPDRLAIQRLSCNVVVGLNPCEREDRQLVCFDVDISTIASEALEPENAFDFRRLARDMRQVSSLLAGGHAPSES